jgi:hypothetical protein
MGKPRRPGLPDLNDLGITLGRKRIKPDAERAFQECNAIANEAG